MTENKLKKYIKNKNSFKLILGANNENYETITKYIALYSLAGCKFFDINASKEALFAAKKGLEYSKKEDCFICISVGGNNDPHFKKCKINEDNCKSCKKCICECPQDAISLDCNKVIINEKKCIGCLKCLNICKYNAIQTYQKKVEFENIISELKHECDCIEFHIVSDDIDDIDKKWDYLCQNFDGILSICTNRDVFTNKSLVLQIKKMISKNPDKTIIQADGAPMSGGKDDFNTTLQAIATADILLKAEIDVPIIVSGGTNTKTNELAELCKVNIDGIAVGSFARKIVKEYVMRDDFLENKEIFNTALKIAENFIQKLCK